MPTPTETPSFVKAFIEIPVLPPRSIVLDPPLSDEEFERLCEMTELALVERSNVGTIIVNELAGAMASSANAEINCQFGNWAQRRGIGCGLMYCGFFLSDGSCFSPGLAYVTAEQMGKLSIEERAHFLRLAPVFVIELLPRPERFAQIANKMEAWMANGVQLGWLVDPYAKEVHVYEPGAAPRIESGSLVPGSGPVEGFVLDAEEVWRCDE